MKKDAMPTVLRLELPSELPIIGVELIPKLVIALPGVPTVSDIPASSPVDGLFLSYKWYRVMANKNAIPCHVHPSEPSTLQCQYCANRKSLIAKSYHCSSKCYQDAWGFHKETHERSKKDDKKDLISHNPGGATFYPPRQEFEVGSNRAYTPTAEDVGCILRLEVFVVSAETRKVLRSADSISTTYRVVAFPTPIHRGLISANEVDVKGNPGSFTVLSYNILADTSATSSVYSYCPPWARTWTYRRLNLLKEIVGYGADIICLQEVQNGHLDDFLAPELKKHGYDVCYKRRTSAAQSREGSTIDGCATFYKRDKFKFVKKYEIEFNKAAHALVEAAIPCNEKPLASKRLMKDNIALIVFLELKSGNQAAVPSKKRQLIGVANTRFDVQEDMKDVILWHVNTLLKAMNKLAETSNDVPMIMCGDFNMVPGSAPYSLVVMGNVNQPHQGSLIDPFGILQPPTKLAHHLRLVSAYSAFSRHPTVARLDKHKKNICLDSKEPLLTICTENHKACHDYIFFTGHTLRVEGLMELVDRAELCKKKALPSTEWSSNHIALLAQFRWVLP